MIRIPCTTNLGPPLHLHMDLPFDPTCPWAASTPPPSPPTVVKRRSGRAGPISNDTGWNLHGTIRWASLVPAAMMYAPPCSRLSGKPVDAAVAPGIAIVV